MTILAYGQTGSGKTYTMGSECGTTDKFDDERRGLIPRCVPFPSPPVIEPRGIRRTGHQGIVVCARQENNKRRTHSLRMYATMHMLN